MRNQLNISLQCRRVALITFALLCGNMPLMADPIETGTFFEFAFGAAGSAATGCDPADPTGPFCIGSFGTPTSFAPAPPWTLTAPVGGALFRVTDAFAGGDRFEVFDFGVTLGLTSEPAGAADCGDDPVVCLSTSGISKRIFLLAEGDHSLTIKATLAPSDSGVGYFQASAVPEPGAWALSAAGLILLAGIRFARGSDFRRFLARHPQRGLAVTGLSIAALAALWLQPIAAQYSGPRTFPGPTSSQPLALTADDAFLAVVNPDNNTVSFFDVREDRHRKLAEVPVQTEPNGVAMLPDGSKAYVANTVSGTVSVIPLNLRNGVISKPTNHIAVGTEPYGVALTPNGRKLYVSNSRSDTVSVIDTATDTVIATVTGVGPEPRGLAITNDGDPDDADETVYVTQFLSLPVSGKVDGQDDAKAGHLTVIPTSSDAVGGQVTISPIADTGFKATGDALARIPPGDPADPANFKFTTGAYPNQLNNVAVKGDFAFVPNVGASPNGPVRFDVNTHSLLSVINRQTNRDAGQTINMHLAVKNQTSTPKLFNTIPWVIAFKHSSYEGYVAIAASNVIVKVAVNPTTGAPVVQNDPTDSGRVLQLKAGKNPRGIVINSADTRAYVMNYVSRDITVLDLSVPERVLAASVRSASLPTPGTLADKIHVGRELYNTSVGVFDPAAPGGTPITGRMSNNGWGACAACHPFGLSDNVVWIFPSGPKRTISQHTDFDPADPSRDTIRPLNWSGERDEEEDFELNTRAVSGGLGIIVQEDGVTQDPAVVNLRPQASGGRNQLKVHGVNGWDAIKAYVQFGIRAPISPVSSADPQVVAGRALFAAANCQQCHGGSQWTTARVRFTPPPDASAVSPGGEITAELRNVGTFDPNAFNEVRQNGAAPLGANGFVPPSLLSLFAFPQTFFHNGAAASIEEVLNNVQHRSAGTGGVDTLSNPADRAAVAAFVQSIDARTEPVP